MRVVINGLAALKPKTGVGHHVAQTTRHLAERFPGHRFDLYPGERIGSIIARHVHSPARPGSTRSGGGFKSRGLDRAKAAAKAASQFHFTAYTRTGGYDLYHEPNFIPFSSQLPTVVTVHDLSVVRHPEWHPTDRVHYHDRYFTKGLERSAHVIVVSEAVRREVLADIGLPPDRVSVVYNGIGPAFRPHSPEELLGFRQRLDLPEHYFLCVGTIEPRKNIGTVMRAFVDLPQGVRERCPLVLAGPWGWKSEAERVFYERIAGPRGVRHLGYVPDQALPSLYSGAVALLYPSHYEGFGLPPLEMLACGGAVIATTAEAVREVLGRHGWFVEPSDLAGWRDAMRAVATDPQFLDSIRRGGVDHTTMYTWDRAAEQTFAVYRRVLGKSANESLRVAA